MSTGVRELSGRWSTRADWLPPAGASGAWRPQGDPATGETFARVRDMTPEEVADTIAATSAAHRAAPPLDVAARAELLRALAAAVRSAAEDLGELDARCAGKTRSLAVATANGGAAVLDRYAEQIGRFPFSEELPPAAPGVRQWVDRVPLGVVACVLPWNFLLSQTCARLAMLFGTGNAVVLKGPELAQPPLLAIDQLAREAGWPAWACAVVTGGPDAGRALVEHPAVAGICFTGGVPTGIAVARAAAGDLKRLVLELGGRTPVAVFADADLERAVPAAVEAAFSNAGQACNAGASLLVERPVYEQVAHAVAARAAELRVGDPLDPRTEVGPLISDAQRARIDELVADARALGASVLTGGAPLGERGSFYAPTVLTGVPAGARLHAEEAFGPVVVVEPFDDEREVIARANESDYGLAAGVWTGDPARAERLRRALRVGVLWINTHGAIPPNAPWGGFRKSGLGRLYGDDGLYAFTEVRASYEQLAAPAPPR